MQIAAGDYHAVALAADGTVYTWGNNGYRQLGNSSALETNPSPAPITGVSATQIVAGRGHTAVLRARRHGPSRGATTARARSATA